MIPEPGEAVEQQEETSTGQEPPQDTPETPETPPAQSDPVEPEPPAVDPMAARLQEDNERMRRENEEYRQHLMRQQQAAAPAEQEVDIEKFIEENLGEKSAPVMKQLVKHLEKKLGKRFADRTEFEQTKQAALAADVRAQEQQAIADQKADGVPDEIIGDAKRLILDWAKKGEFYPSAGAAYRAAVGEVLKQKMYGQAANERRKKEILKAKQSNATAPRSEAPSLTEGVPKRIKGETFDQYAARLNKVEIE